jgi:lipoprotein-releasing system permease protein
MYKLLLCVRYLRTKYIALACIISVMLGVATMIVVNSVMAGFTHEMRDRLHNFLSDIVIESRSTEGIPDAQRQMEIVNSVAGQYIAAMAPTIDIPGMITFSDRYSGESYTLPVQIQGIDPESKAQVGPFRSYLDSYNPIIEDGKVIRQPLRAHDEPLSWNLTPSAMDHRIAVKQRDALYLNNRMEEDLLPSGPLTPTTDSETKPGDSVVSPSEVSPDNAPEPVFDTEPSQGSDAATDAGTDTATPASAPSADSDDTEMVAAEPNVGDSSSIDSTGISQDHFLAEENEGPQTVNTEPMAARIYLGEGIVSFQALNPETGKPEKFKMVECGDDVILSTVTAGRPPEVTKFSATVVDSFRSGMNEYDTSIVLMNINELQKNRGMHLDNAITSIHIRLNNYDDAPKAIAALERAFPPGQVTIKTWEQKQGLLLSAVEVETAILNVL